MPHEAGFNAANNPYTNEEFFKICDDYGFSHDHMRYLRGASWPDDYIGPDSMTHWIIKKSQGFTNVGLYRISESVRAYAYLSLQASVRSSIIANTVSALTAQRAFLNNFENIVNHRADI